MASHASQVSEVGQIQFILALHHNGNKNIVDVMFNNQLVATIYGSGPETSNGIRIISQNIKSCTDSNLGGIGCVGIEFNT